MQHRSLSLRGWVVVGGLLAGWMAGGVQAAPATLPSGTGNDTCIDGAVDWYTDSVGETPCRTYERLRQQCNPNFRTPNMLSTAPPDQCDDQQQHCCCNSLAFGLAMLCMNCQYGKGSTASNGIDAGFGAYNAYGDNCAPPDNDLLSPKLEPFLCSSSPRIPEYLVATSFYPPGNWFYNITAQTGMNAIATATNASTCPGENIVISNSSVSDPPGISSAAPTSSTGAVPSSGSSAGSANGVSKSPPTAAIVAAVIGALAIIVAAVIAFFLCRLRRQRGRIFSPRGSEPVHGEEYKSTPFTYSRPTSALPPVTQTQPQSYTTVGHSIEPTRTDFTHSSPSDPEPPASVPPAVMPSWLPRTPLSALSGGRTPSLATPPPTAERPRVDLTAGEEPRRYPSPSMQRDSYLNPGSRTYPFWNASSAGSSDADDGVRVRDSVLRSFDPRGMVRQSPAPTPPISPGMRVVN